MLNQINEIVIEGVDVKFFTKTSCMNCVNGKCAGCSETDLRKQGLISGEKFHCVCCGLGHNRDLINDMGNDNI